MNNLEDMDTIEFLRKKTNDVVFYVISQIDKKGYIPASSNYEWYIPMWFRDSSFISISLTHNARYLNKTDQKNINIIKNASARLLNSMWKAIDGFSENIDRGIELPLENGAFHNNILNHVPARFNQNYKVGWHRHRSDEEMISDNPVLEEEYDLNTSIWLKQYDSVPLLIIATNEYIKNFGIDENMAESLHKILKLLPKMIEYMNKVYVAPCSNAWEIDTHQIHAYDVAAIHCGMENALELIKQFKKEKKNIKNNLKKIKENIINDFDNQNLKNIELHLRIINLVNNEELEEINENKILENINNINRFLKNHFIINKILYKATDNFRNENSLIKEVDGEELFILNRFKPPCITKEIQDNTMQKIEEDLFNNNVLPIRFKGDTYFHGGRWPLLGLEAANWYINNNKIKEAKKIIDYITQKYLLKDNKICEQELINPASKIDPDNYYEKQGNRIIDDLAWSESAYIYTVMNFINNQKNELIC